MKTITPERIERIRAICARALDNDGDNKAGAKSMRAGLEAVLRELPPPPWPR